MNDNKPDLVELIRATAPVVDLEPDWQGILREARQKDAIQVRAWRCRVVLPVAVAVTATAAALVATSPWRGSPSLVDRAAAALTLRSGKVLYEEYTSAATPRNQLVPARVRLWFGPRGMFRELQTINGVTSEFGRASSSAPLLRLDRKRDVLRRDCVSDLYRFRLTPSEITRGYLRRGMLKHVGDTAIAGRTVAILRGRTSTSESDTVYVDRHTYFPVRTIATVSGPSKGTYTITWTAYRYLDATPKTLALADIHAQHPAMRVAGNC